MGSEPCEKPDCPYDDHTWDVIVDELNICRCCFYDQSFYHEVAMMLKKIYIKRRSK